MNLSMLIRTVTAEIIALVLGAALILPLVVISLPALLVLSFSAAGHNRTVSLISLIADWTRRNPRTKPAPTRTGPRNPVRTTDRSR
ncbi:hypothetical protein Kpho02_72700 [Kitasatospora phosalacinea]|uniref:Uncharacterized protein n=1 Tax=Kitasatospora phosalacinea TaxID=2065 RepID=A0A9W6V660_9ACTN|nr:hypothetical protein [Kitasatospora phosalacinea]GLW74973.1 hypothetical protein Kpho02_72700 [Kitasatospora phosalacinea]